MNPTQGAEPSSRAGERLLQLARILAPGARQCAPLPRVLREVPCSVPTTQRATAQGTIRFLQRQPKGLQANALGSSGLQISQVGFGCHRLEDSEGHRAALTVALQCGINFIDVAPNYTDGAAETAVGKVLRELLTCGKIQREEVVISTKVGNIVGSSLSSPSLRTMRCVAKVAHDVWHCIEPAWIEEELTRSLERLGLECVDVVLLHCPEFALKAPGVNIEEVYGRIARAFEHLENEVDRGRIARYGVSAAFYPLRVADPEHLLLERLLHLLPTGHHFEVIQFPLNFAEPQAVLQGHTARGPDGAAIDKAKGIAAMPLVQIAHQHGIATLSNRPLDGLYGEMRGVLRFASEQPLNGELQDEDVDALEAKLSSLCTPGLGNPEDPVTGELAAKTIKVLASLAHVDCVLVGMRQVEYVANILKVFHQNPSICERAAMDATTSAYNSVSMWFCAFAESDHGTAKDWRLPAR